MGGGRFSAIFSRGACSICRRTYYTSPVDVFLGARGMSFFSRSKKIPRSRCSACLGENDEMFEWEWEDTRLCCPLDPLVGPRQLTRCPGTEGKKMWLFFGNKKKGKWEQIDCWVIDGPCSEVELIGPRVDACFLIFSTHSNCSKPFVLRTNLF